MKLDIERFEGVSNLKKQNSKEQQTTVYHSEIENMPFWPFPKCQIKVGGDREPTAWLLLAEVRSHIFTAVTQGLSLVLGVFSVGRALHSYFVTSP